VLIVNLSFPQILNKGNQGSKGMDEILVGLQAVDKMILFLYTLAVVTGVSYTGSTIALGAIRLGSIPSTPTKEKTSPF
jgi:hypothetical protein